MATTMMPNTMMPSTMMNKPVKDIMTRKLECCNETDTLQCAAQKMKSCNVGCLGVMRNNKLCGMITDRDIVTRCLAEGKDYMKTTVGMCMTTDVQCVSPDDSCQNAHNMMCNRKLRRLVVCDKDCTSYGIISKSDFSAGNKA